MKEEFTKESTEDTAEVRRRNRRGFYLVISAWSLVIQMLNDQPEMTNISPRLSSLCVLSVVNLLFLHIPRLTHAPLRFPLPRLRNAVGIVGPLQHRNPGLPPVRRRSPDEAAERSGRPPRCREQLVSLRSAAFRPLRGRMCVPLRRGS